MIGKNRTCNRGQLPPQMSSISSGNEYRSISKKVVRQDNMVNIWVEWSFADTPLYRPEWTCMATTFVVATAAVSKQTSCDNSCAVRSAGSSQLLVEPGLSGCAVSR